MIKKKRNNESQIYPPKFNYGFTKWKNSEILNKIPISTVRSCNDLIFVQSAPKKSTATIKNWKKCSFNDLSSEGAKGVKKIIEHQNLRENEILFCQWL